MKPWKIDVAVLCIFFARPEQFVKTFEQVRLARPRVLLLWQDGPREGRIDDLENIRKCREIAENIDWECEIHRNYHDRNMGCDPSTFNSHQWAFTIVDKCIILEDDLVASQSFFLFCKEMLDKYENDTRIDRICGLNLLGVYKETPYDYFFANRGSSWGWASWRRVAETWNRNYEFLDDEYTKKLLFDKNPNPEQQKQWMEKCQRHKESGIPYWEDIIGARTLLYNGLVIFPKYNMISNIGIGDNSTHAPKNLQSLPESARRNFNMQTYDVTFPLKEPPYMMEDTVYAKRVAEMLHPSSKRERLRRLGKRVMHKVKAGDLMNTIRARLQNRG